MPTGSAGGLTVLVVDDNEATRYSVGRALGQNGIQVLEAANGEQALSLASRGPDLILLDVNLPDLNGMEVCRRLKAKPETARIPVLHLSSSFRSSEDKVQGLETGADGYLTYPIEPQELLAHIKALVRIHQAERERDQLAAQIEVQSSILNEILSSLPEHIYMFDRSGRYTYANASASRALGIPQEEIIGRTTEELNLPPEVVHEFGQRVQQVFHTGVPYTGQTSFPLKTGNKHFEYILTPLHAETRIESVLASVRDITRRKRIEDQLQLAKLLAESRLAQLNVTIETMTEGVCLADAAGNLLLLNSAFRQLHDLDDPSSPRHVRDIAGWFEIRDMHGHALSLEERPIARALRGETIRECTLRVRNLASGKEFVGRYFGAPVRDSAGKAVMAVITVEDITASKKAEEALRSSELHLRLAQEASNSGSWEWDLTANTIWSEGLWKVLGLAPGSVEPSYENWLKTIHPDDRERVHRLASAAAQSGGDLDFEYRTVWPNGVIRWTSVRGRMLHDEHGRPRRMFGLSMDVTERKQAEEALRMSEKLAAAGRMAGTLAHEINNPMASVANLLFLLDRHTSLDVTARTYVDMANKELGRVQHILKNTLGFYRDSAAPVAVDLREVLDSVLELYSRHIQDKDVRVRKRYDFAGQVQGFPGQLRQVFANLLINAIESVNRGGNIHLHLAPFTHPQTAENGVRVVIADNGHGISPEHRTRLFEPFFTTKGERGTGLGLWVSHGIVLKHQGSVRVRSSTHPERSGTCFAIFLPASRGRTVRNRTVRAGE